MKPLAMFLALDETSDAPVELDDDYAWHVRQRQSDRPSGRRAWPFDPTRTLQRLVASIRPSRLHRGANAVPRT